MIEIRHNEEGWWIGPLESYDEAEDYFKEIQRRGWRMNPNDIMEPSDTLLELTIICVIIGLVLRLYYEIRIRRRWSKMKLWQEILLWFASAMVLVSSAVLAGYVYVWVDDWEGNLEGAILPFVASVFSFFLLLFPLIFCWGIIYNRIEEGNLIWNFNATVWTTKARNVRTQ